MTYREQLLSGAMGFIVAKKEDIRPEILRGAEPLPECDVSAVMKTWREYLRGDSA